MIIGQTIFSVRRGTEHRAEAALEEVRRHLRLAEGLRGHSILRSLGMSPLASALSDDEGQSALRSTHYVVQTQWDSVAEHDAFYASDGMRRAYAVLSSILTSGPYEILYEDLIEQRDKSGIRL
jgi:heme-degrading monooxygenase HmoA